MMTPTLFPISNMMDITMWVTVDFMRVCEKDHNQKDSILRPAFLSRFSFNFHPYSHDVSKFFAGEVERSERKKAAIKPGESASR